MFLRLSPCNWCTQVQADTAPKRAAALWEGPARFGRNRESRIREVRTLHPEDGTAGVGILPKQRPSQRWQLVNGFSFGTSSPQGACAHVELSLLLVLEMTDWACAVKHQAFSEEKEWRIITYSRRATLVGAIPENYEGVFVCRTSRLWLPYIILESSPRKLLHE